MENFNFLGCAPLTFNIHYDFYIITIQGLYSSLNKALNFKINNSITMCIYIVLVSILLKFADI